MKVQKRLFRIGDLAEKLAVEKFVIRFWEKEFEFKTHRSEGGQRFYNDEDLGRFQHIKELLYERGFTIAGAKKEIYKKDSNIKGAQITTFDITEEQRYKIICEQLSALREQLIKLQTLL